MDALSFLKRSTIVHMWMFCTFIISALIVSSCQCLTLILWPINKRWYRDANGQLINLLWLQIVWLADYWSGSEIHLHCDEATINAVGKEHSLYVMNHKQDVDWIVIWQLAERFKALPGAKCLMKNELKYVPFFGWSFYLTEQLFVNRNYAKDKTSLTNHLKDITTFHYPCTTLIFCEGTRYTPEKYEKSQAFAKERGIQGLKHHLLPRTKGFNLCIQAYKGKVPSIYDGTIAYRKGETPSLYDLICGKKFQFHVYVRRLPLNEVPTDSEEATAEYCQELYREKDKAYEYFLEHDTFAGYDSTRPDHVMPATHLPMYVMLMWTVVIGIPLIYYALRILLSGSAIKIIVVLAILYGAFYFAKSLITVTVAAKGSAYGGNKDTRSTGVTNGTGGANGTDQPIQQNKKED